MNLPPTHTAGKRATPGAESHPSEGVTTSKSISPVSPVGGYHLDGAVN